MSGFSAEWLALREPADARARVAGDAALDELRDALVGHADPPGRAPAVLDLGAGSGANLRFLGPRLPGHWPWTLVDHDAGLLRLAAATPGRPATRQLDLAAALPDLPLPPRGLVTASALLDLVSHAWLATLAARCHAAHCSLLFALTYDGRVACKPMDAEDTLIISLVNQHQLTDKGFGPALGPTAAAAAARLFATPGYRLRRVRSDWRLGPDESALQDALLQGWAEAACEMAPGSRPRIAAWLARRRHHLARGRSRLVVGHEDLYGWPVGPKAAP